LAQFAEWINLSLPPLGTARLISFTEEFTEARSSGVDNLGTVSRLRDLRLRSIPREATAVMRKITASQAMVEFARSGTPLMFS
jgi:hypothetical protein